jgi:ribonuclease P protein component
MKAFSLSKEERILHRKDFIRRLPEDRKRVFPHFLIVLKPNNLGMTRLGLTVGKDKGIAVQRNRIKRILREFFRRSKNRLPPSRDIIIIVLRGANSLTYHQVAEELALLLV